MNTVFTTGLPYANGQLHIGHIYEWLLGDSLKRLYEQRGLHACWVSGDDAHGVAVLQQAQKLGVKPHDLVLGLTQERKKTVVALGLEGGNYLSTQEGFHRDFVHRIYKQLLDKGFIVQKKCLQYFSLSGVPLFERDVWGRCRHCQQLSFLGACDNCFQSLEAGDLLDPVCKKTGQKVEQQEILLEHFDWGRTRKDVLLWVHNQKWDSGLKKKVLFDGEQLPSLWCIERPGEYFGVDVPNKDTHFYVWFEALLGYYSFAEHLNKKGEFVHIIGKDIVAFHALRLIGLCVALDWDKPSLLVHGFVVDDKNAKFAKSKGNAPDLQNILTKYSSDTLRYCLLKNTKGVGDIPFSEHALFQTQKQLACLLGNTYRRLFVLANGQTVKLDKQQEARIQAWKKATPRIVETGQAGGWLLEGEKILQEANTLVSSLKLWEQKESLASKQLFSQVVEVLHELTFLLPCGLGRFSSDKENNCLSKDSVFFS